MALPSMALTHEIWCLLWHEWPLQMLSSLQLRSTAAGQGLDLLCWGHSCLIFNAILPQGLGAQALVMVNNRQPTAGAWISCDT
jgi:hypothetical protein